MLRKRYLVGNRLELFYKMENDMSNKVEIEIIGKPFGKQRPKFARMGRFTKVYTPKETIQYEKMTADIFKEKYPEHNIFLGPIKVTVKAFMYIPKSISKKKTALMLSGNILPTVKPDEDNIQKIVKDALNGVAYKDDNQIVESHTYKYYSDNPRVEVLIEEIICK